MKFEEEKNLNLEDFGKPRQKRRRIENEGMTRKAVERKEGRNEVEENRNKL